MPFAVFGLFTLALAALLWWLLKPTRPALPATKATNDETFVISATPPHAQKTENKTVQFASTDLDDDVTAKDASTRALVDTPGATGVVANNDLTPPTFTVDVKKDPHYNEPIRMSSTIKAKDPLGEAHRNTTTPGPTRKQLNDMLEDSPEKTPPLALEKKT